MANVINETPDLWVGTRKSRHPWSQYFNGQTWELVKGNDFACATASMRTNANTAASKRGFSLKTRITPEGNLILKAEPKAAEATEPAQATEGDGNE